MASIWAAAFAANRPHLLPYLDQFAAASGFYAYSSSSGDGATLPWRLMGLNSNLWYKSNSFTQDMEDPADQFRQTGGTHSLVAFTRGRSSFAGGTQQGH